jgi:hypothetical protein
VDAAGIVGIAGGRIAVAPAVAGGGELEPAAVLTDEVLRPLAPAGVVESELAPPMVGGAAALDVTPAAPLIWPAGASAADGGELFDALACALGVAAFFAAQPAIWATSTHASTSLQLVMGSSFRFGSSARP